MIRENLGNLNNDFLQSQVFEFLNSSQGFSIQLSGRNITGTVTAYVLASNGGNDGGTIEANGSKGLSWWGIRQTTAISTTDFT